MQLQSTDYLTWQRALPVEMPNLPDRQAFPIEDWAQPTPIKNCLPRWYKNLPGNLKNLNLSETTQNQGILTSHGHRSAKLCLGLRGITTVGWTIPLSHNLTNPVTYPCHDGNVGRKETMLHPAMITGSGFDQLREDGEYQWEIRIVSFPWRACMAPGWRLMITAHPLTWSPDWFCFSGCVDANYRHNGTNIGSFWNFEYDMDLSKNYYNVEVVLAIRACADRTVTIPAGTCVFSLVPIYDPDYQTPEFKEFPDFVTLSHRT